VKRRLRTSTPAPVAQAWARADYWRRLAATRHPTTFNDKIFYKMLRDHRPLLTPVADKVAVRAYVADRVGDDVLPKLLAVTDTPAELPRLGLPDVFALKATHASGGIVLVSDTASPDARLPDPDTYWPRVAVRPEHVEWDRLAQLCEAWLARTYGGGRYREWAYVDVPPRILVEELLRDAGGGVPLDFKFFVFNGRCRLAQVDSSRYGGHRQNFFAPDWTPLAVELAAPPADVTPEPPRSLARMIEIAELLGTETDLVRVDLYDIDGRAVFGELTSYVLGGQYRFRPPEFDREVGTWWTVPRSYQ
jgi:hypothetical protein